MYLYVCVCLYACASCERAAAFALCATKVERASRQAHKVRTCKLWATCVPGAKLITNNKYTHTLTQTCRDAQTCRQTSSKPYGKSERTQAVASRKKANKQVANGLTGGVGAAGAVGGAPGVWGAAAGV